MWVLNDIRFVDKVDYLLLGTRGSFQATFEYEKSVVWNRFQHRRCYRSFSFKHRKQSIRYCIGAIESGKFLFQFLFDRKSKKDF